MRCFRTVQLEYGNKDQLFSGYGAKLAAARWHETGSAIVYCSTDIETSISERAFHSMILPIEQYNRAVKEKGKNLPAYYYEAVQKVKFAVGEIEIIKTDRIVDLTAEDELNFFLKQASLPEKTLAEARRSAYRQYPPIWTRLLSQYLCDQGYLGFCAPSARSNKGNTLVVFENNLEPENFDILRIEEVEISAIQIQGGTLKKGEIATLEKVFYKSSLCEGEAPILII